MQKNNASPLLSGHAWPVWPEHSWIECKSWSHRIPARTTRTEECSPPLAPPCNSNNTLIIKYITVMLYTIMLVVSLLFFYLYVKVWFLNHSVSPRISAFFFSFVLDRVLCLFTRAQIENFLQCRRLIICMWMSTTHINPLTQWGGRLLE